MPFFLVAVGLMLIITGVRDTYVVFGKQVAKDFTGERNFFTWLLAFGLIGSIGYVPKLRPISVGFMALVMIAMLLSNSKGGDIITKIRAGLNQPVSPKVTDTGTTAADIGTAIQASATAANAAQSGSSAPSGGKSGSSIMGTIARIAGVVGGFFTGGATVPFGAAIGSALDAQAKSQ